MAVPDFQSFFKPLLDIAADGKEHSVQEAREIIARNMGFTEDDFWEVIPKICQNSGNNRIREIFSSMKMIAYESNL